MIKLATTADENSEINKKSKFMLKKIMYLSSYLLPEVPHFPSSLRLPRISPLKTNTQGYIFTLHYSPSIDESHQDDYGAIDHILEKSPGDVQEQRDLWRQLPANHQGLLQVLHERIRIPQFNVAGPALQHSHFELPGRSEGLLLLRDR